MAGRSETAALGRRLVELGPVDGEALAIRRHRAARERALVRTTLARDGVELGEGSLRRGPERPMTMRVLGLDARHALVVRIAAGPTKDERAVAHVLVVVRHVVLVDGAVNRRDLDRAAFATLARRQDWAELI